MKTNKIVIILTRSFWFEAQTLWLLLLSLALFFSCQQFSRKLKLMEADFVRKKGKNYSTRTQSRWFPMGHYEPLSKGMRKKKKYHKQKQQRQQATSIIIIISHHVYIAIMFFVAQSGALIRNVRKRGEGKRTVLWLLIFTHKFSLVRFMWFPCSPISLIRERKHSRIRNYSLIINLPFMCCTHFSLPSHDDSPSVIYDFLINFIGQSCTVSCGTQKWFFLERKHKIRIFCRWQNRKSFDFSIVIVVKFLHRVGKNRLPNEQYVKSMIRKQTTN